MARRDKSVDLLVGFALLPLRVMAHVAKEAVREGARRDARERRRRGSDRAGDAVDEGNGEQGLGVVALVAAFGIAGLFFVVFGLAPVAAARRSISDGSAPPRSAPPEARSASLATANALLVGDDAEAGRQPSPVPTRSATPLPTLAHVADRSDVTSYLRAQNGFVERLGRETLVALHPFGSVAETELLSARNSERRWSLHYRCEGADRRNGQPIRVTVSWAVDYEGEDQHIAIEASSAVSPSARRKLENVLRTSLRLNVRRLLEAPAGEAPPRSP